MTQVEPNQWQGHLSPHWNIGDNPNGGYMVACALRAMTQSVAHPDPLTVTTHFLRPGSPDQPFHVEVDVLRSGKTLSTLRATLSQANKARIEVLAAFGDLGTSAGVTTRIETPPPAIPGPEDCVLRSGATQGIHLPILERLEIRLHPEHAQAGESTRAELAGWIRFADGVPPDACALPLFADAYPPSPFTLLGSVGWVPTLELTVQVRKRPEAGWIQAQFKTEDLQGGRMIESGMLWDQAGDIVAQSRQLGLVMAQG